MIGGSKREKWLHRTPFPRKVPPQGATICGYFVPGGCDVGELYFVPLPTLALSNQILGFSMWALGRNRSVFGEDVDIFRPERWMASRETIKAYERADITFSAGLTTCLGKYGQSLHAVVVMVTNR